MKTTLGLGWIGLLSALTLSAAGQAAPAVAVDSPNGSPGASYARWKHGPSTDPDFFPIAVWLQNPGNAARFKAAGINLYIGLWDGPTARQLADLEKVGMPVICAQNRVGLENKDNPIIVGWMHGDEPDNAQAVPGLRSYGPPILPSKIVADYERIQAADPTRPVLLNLGQGVAFDDYIGRGVRRNHPEDYPKYMKGGDIVSFDIYPVVHESPRIAGKLEYVAQGVERLVKWGAGDKIIWNCIECTHISQPNRKATPAQVRSEVWMSLIHGSRGLIYFVHQFKPTFIEAGLLYDPEMLAAVTAINRQIHELAPVLNSPSIGEGVTMKTSVAPGAASTASSRPPVVAWMQKKFKGTTYLFTVNMTPRPVQAQISLTSAPAGGPVDVLGESRRVPLLNGAFTESYQPYEVHLYAVGGAPVR